MIPSCSPSSPMTRISGARRRSLMRVNLSAISRVLLYTREISHKLHGLYHEPAAFLGNTERRWEHGNTRKDTEGSAFRSPGRASPGSFPCPSVSFRVFPVRQDKSGRSRELKGVHHVKSPECM